jgi:ectoine hydroxylase-related dioxygenase (phytanoyl-CoA dioxygenase family)
MDSTRMDRHRGEIDEIGYTIVEDAIEKDLVDEILSEIHRIEALGASAPRGNALEGFKTLRTYNLLAKAPVFQKMPVHDMVLPLVERVLAPDCLLSGMTSMNLGPGEVAQPLHPDDYVIDLPRPHAPLVCTTIWALTDFTEENGGTRLVPGSHRFDHTPDYSRPIESIPAVMRAGSVLVFHGSLWHGSGENRRPDSRRVGINVQYCAGFIRTQQNQYVGVPDEITRGFSDRLLELCGYTLYKGISGHVDGRSPATVLGVERLADTAYASNRSGALRPEEGGAKG